MNATVTNESKGGMAAFFVSPRPDEIGRPKPGDDLVVNPDVTMDRAFDLDAPAESVWPWFAQLERLAPMG